MHESEQDVAVEDLDPFASDESPQAPGGFPSSAQAWGNKLGGTAGLVESLLEALLARLQVSVGQIVVTLHHEVPARSEETAANVDVELKIDGIRYALHQAGTDDVPKKTLTVDDIGVWMWSSKMQERERTTPFTNPEREGELDMKMSFGIADLRESRYGLPDIDTRLRSPESDDDNPAESLYESAIGEETPTASPRIKPSQTAFDADIPGRHLYNKIFGLRKSHVVVQMWKDPPVEGPDTASGGSSAAQTRMNIDLGNLAMVVTPEQVASLFRVFNSLPAAQQSPLQERSIRSTNTAQVSPPHCQLVAAQFDLHHIYGIAKPETSQLQVFWNETELKGIALDNLHLRLQHIQTVCTDSSTLSISLANCALLDAYPHSGGGGESFREQPLVLIGKDSDQIWLPAEEDARWEAALCTGQELGHDPQASLSLSESGKGKDLYDIFVDLLIIGSFRPKTVRGRYPFLLGPVSARALSPSAARTIRHMYRLIQ